jgi:fibronectin type 3 domain-containing protein
MKVTLTWSASPQAVTYNVYRSTVSGQQGTVIGTVAVTTYVDAAIAAGNTYYYSVTGANLAGEGPASSPQQTVVVPNVPAAPTNLVATLGP